ncbi:MAG: hypothetical protein K2I42_07315 [Anaeroplasmataceae bacterium]|nr:hypothetical protein [Anaeroplasmataceae bacterium]
MVVDVIVVIIVLLLVLSVIFFRFIFPKIMNRKIKKKGKECSGCVNCQHR